MTLPVSAKATWTLTLECRVAACPQSESFENKKCPAAQVPGKRNTVMSGMSHKVNFKDRPILSTGELWRSIESLACFSNWGKLKKWLGCTVGKRDKGRAGCNVQVGKSRGELSAESWRWPLAYGLQGTRKTRPLPPLPFPPLPLPPLPLLLHQLHAGSLEARNWGGQVFHLGCLNNKPHRLSDSTAVESKF